MKILFCRIGWCKYYNGDRKDKPMRGGSYNKEKLGHEIYNFKDYNGRYYGFVYSTIDIATNFGEEDNIKTENVLVVWVSSHKSGGSVIIGWYNNATVYRNFQAVPDDVMSERSMKKYNSYIISSDDAVLLPENERDYSIKKSFRMIWYGNDEENRKVCDYIIYKSRVSQIEKGLSDIEGKEKEAIVKVRINQDKFRDGLIKKYGKCCLCGVSNENLLIESHLKPWSVSNNQEKVDLNNGLLLCPNHDKLVDSGLISFSEKGKILISKRLSKRDRELLNISRDMKIDVTDDNAPYVSYHRESIFQEE